MHIFTNPDGRNCDGSTIKSQWDACLDLVSCSYAVIYSEICNVCDSSVKVVWIKWINFINWFPSAARGADQALVEQRVERADLAQRLAAEHLHAHSPNLLWDMAT